MKRPWVIGVLFAGLAVAGDDPGQTAVRYLEQVRAGEVDFNPGKGTALATVTGETKRQEITERVRRFGKDLGSRPFAVETVKLDGDLAAALVKQDDPLDTAKTRVEAVALIRQGEQWLPAPLPGSFENTSLGYDADRSRRQAALVDWMRQQQPLALEALRTGAKERLRKAIAAKISVEELRDRTPDELAGRFLQACQERDAMVVLGLLGGLSPNPPAELEGRAAELTAHFAPGSTSPWRILFAPDGLRTRLSVREEPNSAIIQICGVAYDQPVRFWLTELQFQRDANRLWRLEWPDRFDDNLSLQDFQRRIDGPRLLQAFRRDFPATPYANSKEASDALLSAARKGKASDALRLLDFEGDPPWMFSRILGCAKLQEMLPQPPSVLQWLALDLIEQGDHAVAAFQAFHPYFPDRSNVRMYAFKRTAAGWLWQGNPPDETARQIIAAKKPGWERSWKPRMLAASTELEGIAHGDAPPEAAVRELLTRWETSIAKENTFAALAETAHLTPRDDRPSHFLANFGNAWAVTPRPAPVLGIVRHGRWAGVSLRFQRSDSTRYYPLYPVLQTPAGAKLLLELDLAAGGERTRDFLNEASIQNLGADADAVAELRQLLTLHRQLADADRAKSP